ncbi:MAG: DUF3800 domain-containing protein [Sphaerochaetaceae bacterium]|nr:DUF3800 domain-containing protein [Sphaerochaetaceae bacterium]
MQNIYIYSDESGVFDNKHFEKFVYGGVIFTDKQNLELKSRKYLALERKLRNKKVYKQEPELKAYKLESHDRKLLYSIFGDSIKFAVIINLNKLDSKSTFKDQKTRQMYLDFAFCYGIKAVFEKLIGRGTLFGADDTQLFFYADEHPTANSEKLSLKEMLEKVLKFDTGKYLQPLFPKLSKLEVKYCNSENTTLIRSADIIANHIYGGLTEEEMTNEFVSVVFLP